MRCLTYTHHLVQDVSIHVCIRGPLVGLGPNMRNMLELLIVRFRLYRYVRLLVNAISSWCFRPTPLPGRPNFHPSDVTVVIPTICGEETQSLEETIRSCLDAGAGEMIIVTIDYDRERLSRIAESLGPKVKVLSIVPVFTFPVEVHGYLYWSIYGNTLEPVTSSDETLRSRQRRISMEGCPVFRVDLLHLGRRFSRTTNSSKAIVMKSGAIGFSILTTTISLLVGTTSWDGEL